MNEGQALGAVVLGVVLQWAKGPKQFPTWAAYALVGLAAVAVFVWQTPGIEKVFVTDWRAAASQFAGYLLAFEGTSAAARKAKLAPRTDSI